MLTVDIDMSAINAQIDGIKAKAEAAIRPAAQAGAQVYYEAVLAATPVSKAGHWFHGTSFKKTGRKYWFESGSLKKAVYQVYSKVSSSPRPLNRATPNQAPNTTPTLQAMALASTLTHSERPTMDHKTGSN